jgi:branched-chain amino acid transport system permease protein
MSATRNLGSRSIVAVSLLGAAVLLLLPHFLPPYYLGLAVQMLVFALFAMSLDLLIGYGGMAARGHDP